jgi:WD40 repeat protein/serine/threonine protein kinase
MSTSSDQRNPVELLAEEFLERKRQGEKPTLREYLERHPDLADEIRELFPALLMMEDLGDSSGATTGSLAAQDGIAPMARLERLGDYRILREIGRGGMGVVYEAEQESLGRRVALKVLSAGALVDSQQVRRFEREARAAARLHHTNIVPVFGVGQHEGHHYYVMQFIAGLGLDLVLYDLRLLRRTRTGPKPEKAPEADARDAHEPPAGMAERSRPGLTAAEVARSLIEGRCSREGSPAVGVSTTEPFNGAAVSAPPPIAPAVDSSSVLLPGSTEHSALSDSDRRYYQSVARIGVQVAEALEFANRQGVLHRDIKPSNLLLDNRGNVWVTDFGLAKTADADNLTHTGDIVGTIRYMAPERFQGRCDARSDVYSLGLTLYELVALRPAYEAADRHMLMDHVLHEEPARLMKLAPTVPRDLETIVAKAIARDPAERYATAELLGGDLQRFVDDRPIQARRASLMERAGRWARRNPVVASLTAALVLLLLAVAAGASLAAFRFRDIARIAEYNRYLSDIALAHREVLAEKPGRAEQLLDGCPPHLRGWEWNYLKRQGHTALLTIPAHDDYVFSVAYRPDGKALATCSQDGTLRTWDAVSGRLIRTLPGHAPDICWRVTYSPDGTRLASAGRDKAVRIWDAASGRLIRTLLGHAGTVLGVDFSPDGRLLASSGIGVVKLWDTWTWREIRSLPEPGFTSVKFSRNGRRLGSSSGKGSLLIWETATLVKEVHPAAPILRLEGDFISGPMAFSPDGRSFAVGSKEGSLRIFDVESGGAAIGPLVAHTSYIWEEAFSPDGRYLASTSADQTVRVWEARTGRLLRTFFGHMNRTTGLAFSRDSRRLASASMDRTVKIWDVADISGPARQEARTLPRHPGSAIKVVHRSDGRFFATVNGVDILRATTVRQDPRRAETVTIWDATTGQEIRTLSVPDPKAVACHDVAFDSSFGRIAWARDNGTVEIRDAATGRLTLVLSGHGDLVESVAFSRDGHRIASAGRDATVRVWDAASGQCLQILPGTRDENLGLQFSPDGRCLALDGSDSNRLRPNLVWRWDAATGRTLGESFDEGAMAFHPDSRRIARSVGAEILILDVASGAEMLRLSGHSELIRSMSFSRDGRRLASVAYDGTVKLWEPTTGRELLTLLHGRDEKLTGVSFSPDGRQIVSTSESGTIKVWDATPLPEASMATNGGP